MFHGTAFVLTLLFVLGLGLSRPAQAASGLFSQVTTLTESPPVTNNHFSGTEVSADSRTVLVTDVGYPFPSTLPNKAYIYHFANGQWTLAAELDNPDTTPGNTDYFGFGSALSADGNTALICAGGATVNGQAYAGKAYLYTLSNGTWTLSHEFDDPAATYNDGFCAHAGLSANGTIAAFGAPGTPLNGNIYVGKSYIYSKSNGTWSLKASIPSPDNMAYDQFGSGVAVSGDGSRVLFDSVTSHFAGKAYLYTLSSGSWTQSHEFDDPAATASDNFGLVSVSLSEHGQSAAIGATGTTVNGQAGAGMAYVFHEANGVWSQTAALPDPDATTYDSFGRDTHITPSGTAVIVSSNAAVNGQTNAGKVYLYKLANGSWTQAREFDDPDATAGDFFSGSALSTDGETAVFGAEGATVNGVSGAGKVYIYQSPADLSLALSTSYASLQLYDTEALYATVSNTDTVVTANNVVLSFTLPAGLSYITGNAGNGLCSANGQTATCTLASLAPGATWQPTVLATAVKTGTYTGTATMTSNEPDPATANNAATATVAVEPYSANTSTTGSGSSNSGGGASTPLGLLALALLFGLAGLRRYVLQRRG